MLHNLTGWHALVVLAILLLVFGAAKLPALAEGVGRSLRILKDEIRDEPVASRQDSVPAAGAQAPTTVSGTPIPNRPAS